MTLFLVTVKRIFKNKLNLIFMLFMPLVFIVLTMMSSFEGRLMIGVVNEDGTSFAEGLVKNLELKGKVVFIQREDIRPYIIDGGVDYIIDLEKGFTRSIIEGKDVQLKSYSIKESNTSVSVKMFVNSYINTAKNIAKASEGSEDKFYKGLEDYKNGSFRAGYINSEVEGDTRQKTATALGFVIMGILFLSTFAPTITLKDKLSRTYYRVFTTPVTIKNYMLQNILSYVIVSVIQVAALLGIMKLFNADLGPSPVSLFLMLLLFSLVSISLGMFISSISKDMKQAGAISTLLNTPLLMLGGCYWPMEFMPQILRNISKFLPTTWGLQAAREVVFGANLMSLGLEIGILLLFAGVFFLMGTWRRADIAR